MGAAQTSVKGIAAKLTGASSPGRANRLLVMSNRAPIRVVNEDGKEKIAPTVGGVGSTFLRLLERYGGMWIVWSGTKSGHGRVMMPPADPQFSMVFARLRERDISDYYYGMCNRGLWPLMHFMILNCRFESAQWESYCRVNQIFASAAEAEAQSYDIAWIQDFHLALVPKLLRERRPQLPIGLFWHVPWPPEQVFRVFPWREQLLAGMLGADQIGFHTASYVKQFLDCCERITGFEVDRASGLVYHDSRVTKVKAFPLGIAVDYFHKLSLSAQVCAHARRIHKAVRTPIVVLGVDRLDYTKGIAERLLGFERFLERNPRFRKRVTMILIAVPSRTRVAEYIALKKHIDELVGRVVGRFSSEGWVPIRYLYTQFPVEELVAYYQAADIALVTPLRDGMNLVAKEYVASQLSDNAVLILSEFAGAAQELDAALLVNPFDVDQIADRLRDAAEMPIEERRERFARLRRSVARNDLDAWSEKFLASLLATQKLGTNAPRMAN
ncbi:MAG: alpha,alpha-trehalose-phosphate synthase (UDP-forming) [Candidatus Binataceae bacterium]